MNYGFYIGQKVVYITGFNMPKYSVHQIEDIGVDFCGCVKIKVQSKSIMLKNIDNMPVRCSYCNRARTFSEYLSSKFAREGWWHASSFRPLITDSQEWAEKLVKEITIEIEEENLVTK